MWPWLNKYPWVRRGAATVLLAVPVVMSWELQGTEHAIWLILALPAFWGAMSLVGAVASGGLLGLALLLFLYSHLRAPAGTNVWLEGFALLLGWGVIGLFRHRLSREERTHREYLFSLEERLVLAREQYKSDLVVTVTNQKKVQKYFLLNRVSRVFGNQLELPKLMEVVIRELRDVIGAERGRYLAAYLPPDGKNPLLLALPGEVSAEMILEDQFGIWATQHRTTLVIADVQKDFRFRLDSAHTPMRSLMIAPFLAEGGRVAGMLRAESIYPGMFTADDARLLTILSDLAGAAAENARLYQWTQELSITDGLTRLYLRRFFNQRLEEEIKRFLEFKAPFTLFILDLDHFKRINDKMGHLGGDQVLMQLADLLRSEARVTDILCRYGGEEFALLLPYTPSQSGFVMAERIRQHVAQSPFPVLKDEVNITVSLGVAGCPEHAQTAEGIIAAADKALYLAKREGRNRVMLAGGEA